MLKSLIISESIPREDAEDAESPPPLLTALLLTNVMLLLLNSCI